MPIYEYKCDACGHVLDALQKVNDEPLKFCPSCSKESLRKLISAPAFRLKGTGWYETDFKKDNKRNLADGGTTAPKAVTDTKTEKAAGATTSKTDSGASGTTSTKSTD
jgi:putative FmdB family regulatory protein